jgi:hypothetical protein
MRPGLISLVFLPMLVLPVLLSKFSEKDYRYLKLNMPVDSKDKSPESFFFTVDNIYKNTEFVEIDLGSINDFKVDSIFQELIKYKLDTLEFLKKSDDYNYGVKFKINHQINYAQIVRLINNCHKFEFKIFALDIYNNNFTVCQKTYSTFKTDTKIGFYCDNSYSVLDDKVSSSFWIKFKTLFHSKLINFIFFGYFSFLVLSIFWKKNQ